MTPQKLSQILKAVDDVLNSTPPPHYAAFDADGTLWNTDLGEALFKYQIKHHLVPLPPKAFEYYFETKENVSHEKAYLWLAQINKGVSLEQVRAWAKTSVNELDPVPVFENQKILIEHLVKRNVKVFIVTASIKWAVEPGARFFGLNYDNVIGIRTKVNDGIITDVQEGPLTYRKGKVDALLIETGGKPPFLSSGNTEGDLSLLESATHLRIVMAASPKSNDNYQTERRLLDIAKERGWFYHDFL